MIFRPPPGDDIKKRLLDRLRNGTARAVADRLPVHFADRRDLDRRAGKERFIGV